MNGAGLFDGIDREQVLRAVFWMATGAALYELITSDDAIGAGDEDEDLDDGALL